MDQLAITFFSHSKEERNAFMEKIAPIKTVVKEDPNSIQVHRILQSINSIDKLYNEALPERSLPKKEILEILNGIAVNE